MRRVFWGGFCLFLGWMLSSCGGGTSTLQSITINQQSAPSPQFNATGTYGNGSQVTPLPVSWINWSFASFIMGQPRYRLTTSAFSFCTQSGSAWTVAAIAPTDPHAPTSGTIDVNVFKDLVTGKTQVEGGFVAATVQVACP